MDTKQNIQGCKPNVLTFEQLLEVLKITRPSLEKFIKEGMPCMDLSFGTKRRNLRFKLESVFSWLENRSMKGGQDD